MEPLPVVSDFAGLNTACTVDDLHQPLRSSSSASNYLLRLLQTLISTAREIHLSKTSCRRSSSSILYRLSLCRVLERLSVLQENEVLPPYLCLSTQPSELSSSICVSRHNPIRWSSTVILYGDPIRWSKIGDPLRWSFMFGLIWKCSLLFPPFNRWGLKALSVMGDQYVWIDLKTHSTLSQRKQVRPQGTVTYGDQCVCSIPNVDILTVWLGGWHWHRPHLTEFVWV